MATNRRPVNVRNSVLVPAPTSASTCAKNAVSVGCFAIVVESLEREVEGLESVQALAWERAGLSVDDETRESSTLSSHRYLSTMWIMNLNQMI